MGICNTMLLNPLVIGTLPEHPLYQRIPPVTSGAFWCQRDHPSWGLEMGYGCAHGEPLMNLFIFLSSVLFLFILLFLEFSFISFRPSLLLLGAPHCTIYLLKRTFTTSLSFFCRSRTPSTSNTSIPSRFFLL